MLKTKEYFYLVMSSVICCTLQYYLLVGSHKIGRMNWPYVFPASLIAFLVSNFLYKKYYKDIFYVSIILIFITVIPLIVYTLIEWVYFPASLLNTLNDDAFFYFWTITLVSSGWVFSIALVLNERYRKKLRNAGFPLR